MKLVKKIIIIFLILLVLFGGVTYIDYFLVKTKNNMPKIAIKEEDKVKQVVVYKAPFYKVWHCTSDDSIVIGDYKDSEALCPRVVEYIDGFFTNSAGLKISQRDYELMSYNNTYTFDMISSMTSKSDVDNAVYVAEEYGKTKYSIKENSKFEYESDDVELAVFYEFVIDGNNYKWKSDLEDETKYYCAKKVDDSYEFSKYENESCSSEFSKITMSDKWCELYKTSTLVYSLEDSEPLCSE